MKYKYVKCKHCNHLQLSINEDLGCQNCKQYQNYVVIIRDGVTQYFDEKGNKIKS